MSTIIQFDLKDLKKLSIDKNSCVIEKKVTQNIALQPWCLGNLKESIKNLLDYKIGKFDKEFDGILMSYKNLRVLQNVGTIRNDNADILFQVQADYFIFKPYVGATLTGIVNKKSNTHLSILVHRVFNVVIPRPTEEPGNEWMGSTIKQGQEVKFHIVVLDLFGALPYIRGELDESSIKLDGGVDVDVESNLSYPINVSYVDFEKTKPHIKQQDVEISSDGLPETSESLIKSPTSDKLQITNISQSDGGSTKRSSKSRTTKTEESDKKDRSKLKRQSKSSNSDLESIHKPKKKHKKAT